MSDEEFEDGLQMLRYFWEEKGDVTRWNGYAEFYPELKKRRPDIAYIIKEFKELENAMNTIMKEI